MADNFNLKQFLAENKLGAYSRLREEKSNKQKLIDAGYSESDAEDFADEFEQGGSKVPQKVKDILTGKLKEEKFYAPNYVAQKYGDKAKEIEANIEDEEDNNPNIWDLYTSLETAEETDEFVKGFMNETEEGYMGTQYGSSEDMAVDMIKKGITEDVNQSLIGGILGLLLGSPILISIIRDYKNAKTPEEKKAVLSQATALVGSKMSGNLEEVDVRPFNYSELPTKRYEKNAVRMQDIIDFVKKYPGITMKELALKAYGTGFNYRGDDKEKILQGAIYMIDRAVNAGKIVKVKDIKVGKAVFTFFTPEDYEEFLQKKKSMSVGQITMKENSVEEISGDAYERMASLTSLKAQQAMIKAAEIMMNELTAEGFEVDEIREFFTQLIANDI